MFRSEHHWHSWHLEVYTVYVRCFTCSWSPAFKMEGFMASRKTVNAAITSSTHDPLLSLAAFVRHRVWCVFRRATFLIRMRRQPFHFRNVASLFEHTNSLVSTGSLMWRLLFYHLFQSCQYTKTTMTMGTENKKTGVKKRGKCYSLRVWDRFYSNFWRRFTSAEICSRPSGSN